MPLCRKVCDVAVPVKQIECRIVLAKEVIVDDIVPDQVLAAQRIECRGQIAPVEIAIVRQTLDHLELPVVDELPELAAPLEIDLSGKEGGALDLGCLAPPRQIGRA